jgi:hypothetical protein
MIFNFQPTEFKNWPQGNSSYGFRAIDSNGNSMYTNPWPEPSPETTVEELFEKAVKNCDDEIWKDMLDSLRIEQCGIYMAGDWHGWEEIQPFLENKT